MNEDFYLMSIVNSYKQLDPGVVGMTLIRVVEGDPIQLNVEQPTAAQSDAMVELTPPPNKFISITHPHAFVNLTKPFSPKVVLHPKQREGGIVPVPPPPVAVVIEATIPFPKSSMNSISQSQPDESVQV